MTYENRDLIIGEQSGNLLNKLNDMAFNARKDS